MKLLVVICVVFKTETQSHDEWAGSERDRAVSAQCRCGSALFHIVLFSTSLNQCQMSLSEEMENTDLLGLIFPDEDPGSGDLFLTEGNNLLDDLLSEQDV